MANVTVKFSRGAIDRFAKRIKGIEELNKKSVADQIGEIVVAEMKTMIASGTSPIKGNGRFPRYKDPKKYPRGQKPNTPVNLKLSGDFLGDLTYRTESSSTGQKARVGYFTQYGNDLEDGHRKQNPSRPTIPKRGEEFATRIVAKVRAFIRELAKKV